MIIQCAVSTGDLPVNITWKYPGDHQITSVTDSQRPLVTVTKMGDRVTMLSIDSLTADHAGNYTCIASNAAATATHTAELHINGSVSKSSLFNSLKYILFSYHSLSS